MTSQEAELPSHEASGAVPIIVHHRREWIGRALYYDAMALALLLISSAAIALDIYQAGYGRALAPVPASAANFQPLAEMALQAAIFIASFAWIAARLLRASYREMPKVE